MNRQKLAGQLVNLAKAIMAEEDDTFSQQLKKVKQALPKLSQKKKMKLSEFGIETIRPTMKVEDLMDALDKIVSA